MPSSCQNTGYLVQGGGRKRRCFKKQERNGCEHFEILLYFVVAFLREVWFSLYRLARGVRTAANLLREKRPSGRDRIGNRIDISSALFREVID